LSKIEASRKCEKIGNPQSNCECHCFDPDGEPSIYSNKISLAALKLVIVSVHTGHFRGNPTPAINLRLRSSIDNVFLNEQDEMMSGLMKLQVDQIRKRKEREEKK
jgi:hypothetical protein